ncbi:transmembrane protein 234 homolog isoform X2 [Fopius arisanus]|uniref:Transmembrane protein 234 homolog isoform X2 n=1 Tax=Fopius arisanus TaxID=64838 RepID=A0A9R1TKK5_9HYME|nr:PREDICTED: transmembrane protein 234 homolog isoform X2 [Fopius arisanus]
MAVTLGAVGVENVQASTSSARFFKQIFFLFTNLKYLVPFSINQCGSLLYVASLGSTDLSLAVPVANSLTFAFTGLAGWFLGEEKPNKITYMGILMILAGTALCCLDKLSPDDEITS